uniref:myrosinase-binding protein 2-like n=1 Tax=Epinephelus lanceolatus TaxID=310571 RepID=UPI0014483B2B|nr:myrosinase-binding protein 2-like [Epinephelus lanceolatus]
MLKVALVLGCLLSIALAHPVEHKRLARSESDSDSGSNEARPKPVPVPVPVPVPAPVPAPAPAPAAPAAPALPDFVKNFFDVLSKLATPPTPPKK